MQRTGIHSPNRLLTGRKAQVPERVSYSEVADLLRRNRFWIAGSVLASVVATLLIGHFTIPQHSASALVLIDMRRYEDSQRNSSLVSNIKLTNELIVLRQSFLIQQRVARALVEMKRLPGTQEPLPILQTEPGSPPLTAGLVAARVFRRISIEPEGVDTDVINITARSSSPHEAALLANMFAQQFVRRTLESSRARATASRTFLEKQANKVNTELQSIEGRIQSFMASEGVVSPDEEAHNTVNIVAQLDEQRDQAQVDIQRRQAQLDMLQAQLREASPRLARLMSSTAPTEIEATQKEIARLQIQIDHIEAQNIGRSLTSNQSRELQSYETRLNQLRDKVSRLADEYVTESLRAGGVDLSTDRSGLSSVSRLQQQIVDEQVALSGLRSQMAVINQRLGEHNARLRGIPAQSIRLAQMQRSRQASEQEYLSLVEELNRMRILEESEIGYAEIIRPAAVPLFATNLLDPRRLIFGGALGLLFGLGIALARNATDKRIYDPDQIKALGLNLFGIVPDLKSTVKDILKGRKKKTDVHGISPQIVTLVAPMSSAAEAYKELRTNIQFGHRSGAAQTILVTSPGPGTGKTVTAANLAVVMAQSGRRTLLIDADLRQPRQDTKLGVGSHRELSQLLELDPMELQYSWLAMPADDLYLITSQSGAPNPPEILGSESFRNLVARYRDLFDTIIFDSPPVLAATDAAILSTHCDLTLIVVSAGATAENELMRALDSLQQVRINQVGIVLNRFSPKFAQGYTYYRHYGYGSGDHYGDPKRRQIPRTTEVL